MHFVPIKLFLLKKGGRPNLDHLPTSIPDTKLLTPWNLQSVEKAGIVVTKKIIGIMSEVCIA